MTALAVSDLDRVRSLTVKPPWSGAIVRGWKPVENRSRNFVGTWRGRLLIFSSFQKWDPAAAPFISALAGCPSPSREQCHPGHCIGAVDLVDVHRAAGLCCGPWGQPTGFHLVFANAVEFAKPVPSVGHFGLRRVTDPALLRAA